MLEQLLVWERDAFFMLNGSDSAFLDRFMWIYSGKAVWLPLALSLIHILKMTINLRKVLFFLLTLCLIGSAYAQDTALKEAEVAYTKEDYAKAIELYEGILKSNGESAAVYYNLGNTYYKAGKIAPAMLNLSLIHISPVR